MTGNELISYMYTRIKTLIKDGKIKIGGKLYKRDERPLDSKNEDCVIALIAGNARQIQEGEVVVNIYVPDIVNAQGFNKEDRKRAEYMEHQLDKLPAMLNSMGDVTFRTSGMILTLEEPEIKQHFASTKMTFKVLTDYYN